MCQAVAMETCNLLRHGSVNGLLKFLHGIFLIGVILLISVILRISANESITVSHMLTKLAYSYY